jgi:para-aminobenzoate synthetase
VVGPGPGSPEVLQDIGVVKDLWKLKGRDLIPIFGVCLGLQSLGVEFGARLKKLRVVKHGQVSKIIHEGVDIFQGVGDVHAVRYHSLHVELEEGGDVQQLAWSDDGAENGRVVMAAKHKWCPFWAVQYHPESVCTKGGGAEVLRNFWNLAFEWTVRQGRTQLPWSTSASRAFGLPWPQLSLQSSPTLPSQSGPKTVTTKILDAPDLSLTTICELLGAAKESSPFVLLDSAAQPGRYSIVASLAPTSPHIT